MADFFSDSDGEKADEVILSQAMDSTVLDQVAAINCAGFTDSGLPSQLEARFHGLKSFLSSAPLSKASTSHIRRTSRKTRIPAKKKRAATKKCPQTVRRNAHRLSDNNNSPVLPLKENPRRKLDKKGSSRRRKSPSSCSSSSSEVFSSRSISPPVKTGCFLFPPKRVSKKKKENFGLDWGKDDGKILSDLSNQRSMKRKAMEEEEKICEEAEKLVKWVKQASARIVVSGIEDELSDEENVRFCFLCSPKVSKKRNKENLGLDWELLSDLSNFSVSNQRRMMKIAMEEEEKICEEAEKLVKWVNQALARMDDELSDGENVKFH